MTEKAVLKQNAPAKVTKDSVEPSNRKARRKAKERKGGLYCREIISIEERTFRNRKKKLASNSKKRNRK